MSLFKDTKRSKCSLTDSVFSISDYHINGLSTEFNESALDNDIQNLGTLNLRRRSLKAFQPSGKLKNLNLERTSIPKTYMKKYMVASNFRK